MVKPMMNRIREASIRTMPHCCPGVPERMAWGGYSVQPAPVGPPGMKKLATRTSTASR